jgi:ubiquitin conjugation factor E4 B
MCPNPHIFDRNGDFFVRFVNLLMNDTTFLLDEALSKLSEIRNLQLEMADPAFASKPQQFRTERESTLRQDERQASSYISLGNETLHMLQYLTSEPRIVEPFMAPEVVDRLAAMLTYNLKTLVGPKCTELKVKNPEKYRFDPKKLLSELIQIYLHLAHRKEFVQAVARDGRSYERRHFDRAAGILQRTRLAGQADIDSLMAFVAEVETAVRADMMMEEDMGEAPEEFLGVSKERSELIVRKPLTVRSLSSQTPSCSRSWKTRSCYRHPRASWTGLPFARTCFRTRTILSIGSR